MLWCGVVLVVHWVLGEYNRRLSRGAQREILLKYVIVRAYIACKNLMY